MIALIILIAGLAITGWVYTKRTTIEVCALTEHNGDVKVYTASIWTSALYRGQEELVYEHLVKVVQRNVHLEDNWLYGVDFGIWDGDEYVFVVRYEDLYNNINA